MADTLKEKLNKDIFEENKKEKGIFFQVTSVLITQVIFSAVSMFLLSALFYSVFKSPLVDLLNFNPLLPVIFNLFVLSIGLFFGVSYIVLKTNIYENKIKKISIWVAVLVAFGAVLNITVPIADIFTLLNEIVLIPVFAYFYTNYLLVHKKDKIEQVMGKIGFRKVEFFVFALYILTPLVFVVFLLNVMETRNYEALNFFPEEPRQEIIKMMEENEEFHQSQLDPFRLSRGLAVVNVLDVSFYINKQYPVSLEEDEFVQESEETSMEFRKIFGHEKDDRDYIGLDNFTYETFNNRQNFKLCIDLSDGSQKCWEK